MQKDMVFANPNNPVVILRFAHPAIVPIEGAVLFELGICTISGHFIIIFSILRPILINCQLFSIFKLFFIDSNTAENTILYIARAILKQIPVCCNCETWKLIVTHFLSG